jgi:hypothetical protein
VVGIRQNAAERDGKSLDIGCCIVFELKNGRVIDGPEHIYALQALDEFWPYGLQMLAGWWSRSRHQNHCRSAQPMSLIGQLRPSHLAPMLTYVRFGS